MNIGALDVATVTGYAFGPKSGVEGCGTFRLPGLDDETLPRSLSELYAAVQSIVRFHGLEGLVIESPLQHVTRLNKRGVRTPSSADGQRVLTMLAGTAMAAAYSGGVRKFWSPEPSHWRKQVLGAGFPPNPKAAAIRYCELVLKLNFRPKQHDAAEACCLWQYGQAQGRLL